MIIWIRIFIKCDEDDQYVWGLYFVPEHEAQKVKAVYSSMHFERIYMPDTYEGTAKEAFEQLTETRNRAAADLASADQKKADFLLRNQKDIVASRNAIAQLPVTLMCADLRHVHMGIKTFSISYVDG